jgi:HlyD family secretion protein
MNKLLKILIAGILLVLIVSGYLYVKKTKPITELVLYGNVDVRQVDIGFRVSGRVVSMPFQEGDQVAPNTLIATLDNQPYLDEVVKAEAAIQVVQASLDNAKLLLNRRERLVKEKGVSEEDYETARSNCAVFEAQLAEAKAELGIALTNLKDTNAFAPNAGVILTRIREIGTVVKAADPVYTVSLTNPVWVRAFVSEPQLGLIYPGMPARVYTDTRGDSFYTGHIGFISPVAEFTPKTVQSAELRTELVYRLRVIVDNPDLYDSPGLRQGMPVTVKIPLKREISE